MNFNEGQGISRMSPPFWMESGNEIREEPITMVMGTEELLDKLPAKLKMQVLELPMNTLAIHGSVSALFTES